MGSRKIKGTWTEVKDLRAELNTTRYLLDRWITAHEQQEITILEQELEIERLGEELLSKGFSETHYNWRGSQIRLLQAEVTKLRLHA